MKQLLLCLILAVTFDGVLAAGILVSWQASNELLVVCKKDESLTTVKSKRWCVYVDDFGSCRIVTAEMIQHKDLGSAFHVCILNKSDND